VLAANSKGAFGISAAAQLAEEPPALRAESHAEAEKAQERWGVEAGARKKKKIEASKKV
jgi:ribosomal protein L7/L12